MIAVQAFQSNLLCVAACAAGARGGLCRHRRCDNPIHVRSWLAQFHYISYLVHYVAADDNKCLACSTDEVFLYGARYCVLMQDS